MNMYIIQTREGHQPKHRLWCDNHPL
jgi:hypothetical protein